MIRRGSIVLVALSGDYGKPRPAVVVQADIDRDLVTRIVCPITSDVHENQQPIRPIVDASAGNGLRLRSQVMVDKPHVALVRKLGDPIGTLAPAEIAAVDSALAILLGLA
ncbi:MULTISPECIES: type II toxin-antitoxin system PemK/MazF family toxin [unclassified Devosia]|uniref:type II toxin-antitoxin system PemK/MazF family toxin n=1 Tax=unclassified Devosia TaxID=196773 RepID=UPI0025C4B938|nr:MULTISPECIES: type II toxin-antitoxin system PemK/MazF family toxin [unclassified Devosia]